MGETVSTAFKLEKNTVIDSSEITNKFNIHFTSTAKQIEKKPIKSKHTRNI